MGDNMTIDVNGIIAIGEDTGNAAHNPKVWQYNTNTVALTQIFESDPTKFGNLADGVFTPPTAPFTSDKEVSGVLDVTSLLRTRPGISRAARSNWPTTSPLRLSEQRPARR